VGYPDPDARPKRLTRGKVVVAIPVKNEAARIIPCLRSLSEQTLPPDEVVLLLNNCTDRTRALAAAAAPDLRFRLRILSVMLPAGEANAGNARRHAMDHAAAIAGGNGFVLTTDADAIAASDWVEKGLGGLLAGADIVCGRIEIDPTEAGLIPAHLHADDALECELISLLDEIAHCLDPDPADTWPRHTEAAGASLAVSVRAFRRVGGIPAIASGEDRAFVACLAGIDARIRHDPAVKVMVSARIDGRAPGGMADTIRRRINRQDEFTDDKVEYPGDAYRRADFRRRARAAWNQRRAGHDAPHPHCPGGFSRGFAEDLAVDLGLRGTRLNEMLAAPYFGEAWAAIEANTRLLTRRRVRFIDLPKQIAYARLLLGRTAGSGTDVSGDWRRGDWRRGDWRRTVPPRGENPGERTIALDQPDPRA
jgi:glycosyltransferase involved in cell wall biosynthesis